ncbi:MAG: 2-amino-4-hydroxy-6-hydroxymethyldihydropteridine diphosphokinase [Ignavibacteriae bacterium]|nr:2-amino-4-hydroxy-6-hydroxymethyldihydropteridine diphosphokinase [Ignavibacteriota bacterium]
MYRVFLGLGSNLGNRLEYLSKAVNELSHIAKIIHLSSIYETAPVGMNSQRMFYNMVIEIESSISPRQLFEKLKVIEKQVGRTSMVHLQDREIDIDILLYDGMQYTDETITVPHPELCNRRFVLAPFAEIAPGVVHPLSGKTVITLLEQSKDRSHVDKTELGIERIQSN